MTTDWNEPAGKKSLSWDEPAGVKSSSWDEFAGEQSTNWIEGAYAVEEVAAAEIVGRQYGTVKVSHPPSMPSTSSLPQPKTSTALD